MKPNRKSFFLTIALAMALSLASAWPCAAAVPDPTPTDLGALSGLGHNFSEAYAINAAGQIVGESYEGDEPRLKPFIWQNGVMVPLPLLEGFSEGVATSINDAGQVAGYCKDADSLQACLWTDESGGWAMTALGTPSFTLPGYGENPEQELTFINSRAVKINNAGQILVMAWGIVGEDEMVDIAVGAIWQDGAWSYLSDPDGLPNVVSGGLFKMNENGQVLFTKENINEEDHDLWVWDGETAFELVEAVSWANLNNSGQIVGRYFNYNNNPMRSENFTYDTATKMLNCFPVSDGGYSLVNINDNGQVLVEYEPQPTFENGNLISIRIGLGITSFEDWSLAAASVTSLGSVDDYIDHHSLNFNGNGEVSGSCYTVDKLFYASEEAGVMPLTGFFPDDSYLKVTAMNDSGVIIGRALVSIVPNSQARAVMWGEVGPPASTLDILIDPPGPVPVNTSITSGAFLSDSQTTDIHSASWDWGDGSNSNGTIDKESKIVTGAHSYAEPGVYKVALEIFNSDKELLSYAVYQYVVVYDPTAGFVTGGGWFNSPAGAYKGELSLQGQATFGFVSRYKKGATIPTGNTAFEFAAGDLCFQSTSYDWLVVTGSDYARFKGAGTINGGGDYKFMLWAGDGSPDTFRIRIWKEDEATEEETDVYDNGADQPINGGSIVIHAR